MSTVTTIRFRDCIRREIGARLLEGYSGRNQVVDTFLRRASLSVRSLRFRSSGVFDKLDRNSPAPTHRAHARCDVSSVMGNE